MKSKNKILSFALTVIMIISAVSLVISSPSVTGRTEPTHVAFIQSTSGRAYSNESVLVNISFSTYDRFFTIANRIIDNGWYNGPVNSMVQAANGDYLAFVREGTSHVGDNGSLKLYRSVNNAIDFSMVATLRNISDRDIRNPASGITDTGRIFVFYAIYDPLNTTWPNPVEYQYSDNNGNTWSGPITMSLPTVNGFTPSLTDPYGGGSYGILRTIADGRIGISAFFGNGAYVQVRFIYSDDDGATWHHVAMGYPTGPSPNFWSETELLYLGNSRLVALARMDAESGPQMFTSSDNGLTWVARGALPFSLPGSTMSSLAMISDTVGEPWVLAILYQASSWWYSTAYGDDLMNLGTTAWSDLTSITGYDPGDVWGGFPVTLFHADTGNGFVMTTFETGGHANVLMFNLTASVTLTRYVDIVSAPVAFDIVHTEGMASCTYDGFTYIVSTDLGGLLINMTIWNPGRNQTDQPVSGWIANSTDSNATVSFTLSGLESGTQYSVYVDGNTLGSSILTGDTGTISFIYSGPWSDHTFIVDISDLQTLMDILWPLLSIAIIFMVLSAMFGFIAGSTGGKRKK
jgi:hypothetical protein